MRVHFGRQIGRLATALALVGWVASPALAQDATPSSDTTVAGTHVTFTPTLSASTTASANPLAAFISFSDADQANQTQTTAPPPPAQSSHHEGFGFGIKGGFLFKSISQSPVNGDTLSSKTGETIGIFFGGNRPGRVGVMGELDYNIRKASDAGANLSINSIEIPVLIRVNVGSQSLKGVLGYIIFGPAVDIQLKASQNGVDVGDNFKGLNLDLVGGGGVEITRFFIEARGDWGLRSVNNGNLGNTQAIHSKTFELLFGFRIN